MAATQVGAPVGAGRLVNPGLSANNTGDSGLSTAVFAATKDMAALRAAVTNINVTLGGYYTDSILDSMTQNDLLFVIMSNQDSVTAASTTAAWAGTHAYDVGSKVTITGGTLQATKAGTSSGTAPANPGSVGGTVTDGTVKWTRVL